MQIRPAVHGGASASRFSVRDYSAIVVLVLYVIGKMFYTNTSGGAQVADIAIAFASLIYIRERFLRQVAQPVIFYLIFLSIVAVVNLSWYMVYNNIDFIQSVVFYSFNAIVFLFTISVAAKHKDKLVYPLSVGLSVALLIQIFVVSSHLGESARYSGTFQNPNQLGYWAICTLGMFYVCRDKKIGAWDAVFTIGVMYVVYSSMSRSAIVAALALVVIHYFRSSPRYTILAVFISFVVGLLLLTMPGPAQREIQGQFQRMEAIENLDQRFESSASSSQYETRGYDRIADNIDMLALGAGEGYHERFSSIGRELHSTPGTVLFSYGVFGFVLFVILLISIAGYTNIAAYFYLFPFLLYGATHQGLRFSFFWVFCALLACASRGLLSSRSAARSSPRRWRIRLRPSP